MPCTFRAFLIAITLLPATVLAAEPVLIYERVHQQVADEDNAIRLVIFADNRVEAHFPFYSPNAGAHSWLITPGEKAALLDLVAPLLEMQSAGLMDAIESQRNQSLQVVADADMVTIEVNDASRGTNRITAPSPQIWAQNLPSGHAMETVANIADALSNWMRENVGEHQP